MQVLYITNLALRYAYHHYIHFKYIALYSLLQNSVSSLMLYVYTRNMNVSNRPILLDSCITVLLVFRLSIYV